MFESTSALKAKIASLEAAQADSSVKITALEARATAAEALAAEAGTTVTRLQGELDEANTKLAGFEGVSQQIEQEKAKVTALTEQNTTITAELEQVKAGLPTKINAGVTAAVAAAGHAPIDAEVAENPAKVETKPVLTGRAKAVSYFASRQPKPSNN